MPQFSRVTKSHHYHVIVVGGGITGLTAAYLLKQAGKRVCVLQRDLLGSGDTSRTTAHLTIATDLRLSQLASSFGQEQGASSGREALRPSTRSRASPNRKRFASSSVCRVIFTRHWGKSAMKRRNSTPIANWRQSWVSLPPLLTRSRSSGGRACGFRTRPSFIPRDLSGRPGQGH